jgi:macrodomain Ter protein organizer (MatP/YcbG family)
MLTDLRISLSQNKGQLSEEDYAILSATIRTMLEEMAKRNKVKHISNTLKKDNK